MAYDSVLLFLESAHSSVMVTCAHAGVTLMDLQTRHIIEALGATRHTPWLRQRDAPGLTLQVCSKLEGLGHGVHAPSDVHRALRKCRLGPEVLAQAHIERTAWNKGHANKVWLFGALGGAAMRDGAVTAQPVTAACDGRSWRSGAKVSPSLECPLSTILGRVQ